MNERAFARHREMMAEMDDKLNGLIAILDDMIRRDEDRLAVAHSPPAQHFGGC